MNASQFYVTLADDLDYLDEKHTVFGEVAEGMLPADDHRHHHHHHHYFRGYAQALMFSRRSILRLWMKTIVLCRIYEYDTPSSWMTLSQTPQPLLSPIILRYITITNTISIPMADITLYYLGTRTR